MSTGESETRKRILAAAWRLLEHPRDQAIRMSEIAAAAGVSRQALYLHFTSRTDLLVATTRYMDEVLGLDERLRLWEAATLGVDLLTTYIEFWGNYVPEIYGVAKTLLAARETDEAAAAAWNDRMQAVRSGCRYTIEALHREGTLAPEWTPEAATDLFWTLLSVRNWEQLTVECGWTTAQYIGRMQAVTRRAFLQNPAAPGDR